MKLKECINQWLEDHNIGYDLHDDCCGGYGSDDGPFWDVTESRQTSIISAPSPRSWERTFQSGEIVVCKLRNSEHLKPLLIAVLNYHDSEFFDKLEEAISDRGHGHG